MVNFCRNPLSQENIFEKLKESHDDVLILGPTGAGKGYLAKRLHRESVSRSRKKFIHVNCAAISSNLFESQMFGHSKGSFTGAYENSMGYCGAVEDGDLFLDEIGDLSQDSQAKLLVLICDRTYMSVGNYEERIFHGRIIAATNKNLAKVVAAGRFREDLYYRLNTFILKVKPLHEQKAIIPALAAQFVSEEGSRMVFDDSALQYLSELQWPGNIRQLRSVIKKIIRYSGHSQKILTVSDVIPYVEEEAVLGYERNGVSGDLDLPNLVRALFNHVGGSFNTWAGLFLDYAVEANGRNIVATAKNVGLSRNVLRGLLKRYAFGPVRLQESPPPSEEGDCGG